jgi:hypothetical protein
VFRPWICCRMIRRVFLSLRSSLLIKYQIQKGLFPTHVAFISPTCTCGLQPQIRADAHTPTWLFSTDNCLPTERRVTLHFSFANWSKVSGWVHCLQSVRWLYAFLQLASELPLSRHGYAKRGSNELGPQRTGLSECTRAYERV